MNDKEKDEYIAQLENIIAAIPGNLYWKSRNGTFLGCNNNLLKILHLNSKHDFIGKTTEELLGKETAAALLANDEYVMTTGQEYHIEEIGPNEEIPNAIYLTKKKPLRNISGEIVGLLGISFDISTQKNLEQALKNTQRELEHSLEEKNRFIYNMTYLDNIISAIPGSIYWKDLNGKYLGCNDKALQLAQLTSKEEIIGKTIYELFDESLVKTILKTDERVISTHQEETIEEVGVDIDGKPATYLTTKVPLLDERGVTIGLLGISFDITERKKEEKELRKAKEYAETANQTKSEFLAMISHELRTPLTGILGLAQMIDYDTQLSSEHKNDITSIIQSGEHLLSLLNDLLDVSKLEAHKTKLSIDSIDLKQIIKDLALLLKSKAKQKNLKLLTHYAADAPQVLLGDIRILKQVLLNLMGNAIKFTNDGSITIQVDCLKQTATQAILKIAVQDTGIGISPDKLETIFEQFTQADASITRKFGGTGLGLAISKKHVELMHGKLKVHSEPGKGSTFSCEIPFQLPIQTSATVSQNISNVARKSANTASTEKNYLTILLVEDNEIVAKVHIAMLKNAGHTVKHVATGHEAIAIANNSFDLILMDVGLPDISGYETTRMIRKHQEKTNQRTPIIGLTAYGHEEYKTKCLEAGMDSVAVKPVKATELEQLMKDQIKC